MGLRGAQPGSVFYVGAAVVGRADHGLKYRGVIHHYGSEIRHEHLEASNALPDHVVQFRKTAFGQVQDDHMKAVIDSRFPFSFLVPLLKRLLQGVTTLLHREIHDTGSASIGSRDGAGTKIARGDRATERKIQVGMRFYTTTYNVLASGIYGFVRIGGQVDPNSADLSIVNQDVGDVTIDSSENVAVLYQDAHGHFLALG